MVEKVALITGGTSGIGLSTARLLAERGFSVVVTGTSARSLASAREQLPPGVVTVRADLRSTADAHDVAAEIEERFGRLDALFLNAGIATVGPVDSFTEEAYDDLFAVNTKGQFFTLQKVLPMMSTGGSIVFTVGIAATRAMAGHVVLAASRGALLSMVTNLALELASRRIRVNAVSPGLTATRIWAQVAGSEAGGAEAQDSAAEQIPFGRLAQPLEVAQTVAFLLGDESRYVTGEHVLVGGGIGLGV